jgi:hypothetical protein
MSQISRPMQIALGATLLLLVVWFVALRPKPASEGEAPAPAPAEQPASSGAAPGTEGLMNAIDKAHQAAATANGDAERAAQSDAEAPPATTGGAGSGAAQTRGAGRSARGGGGASGGVSTQPIHAHGPVASVRAALRLHKAVAIAFVDSAAADSRAVGRELRHVSRFGGRAFTLAVPLAHLSDYAFITNTVEVTVAPTVVILDPRHRATTIVGVADRVEIEQRLADALKVKP